MDQQGSRVARRRFVLGAGLLGLEVLGGFHRVAAAQYPERDIAFMIPNAAGGSYDNYVRAIGPAMTPFLASRVGIIPSNVEGAGGVREGVLLSRSKPDGYTIGVLNVLGLLLLKQKGGNLGFDLNDLTWIGNLARDHYALVVAADSKVRTIEDLQALSRQRPIKFTSSGPETMSYAATLIGSSLLNIRPQMVAGYRGTSECLVAVMRGDGDATVLTLPAMAEMVSSRLVRVVASFETKSSVSGAQDATSLSRPELSHIIELRPVAGPRQLPPAIATQLSDALSKAMATAKVQAWAARTGANLDPLSPSATALLVQQQADFIGRWSHYLPAL